MEYQVLFDASKEGYVWWGPALGLVLLAFELLLWKQCRQMPFKRELVFVFLVVGILFTACLTISAFTGSYGDYTEVRNRISTNQYEVTEGPIINFQPGGVDGRKVESFTVNNVTFRYNAADVGNPGFRSESGLHGPLTNGVYARVSYFFDPERDQNIILKLEVRK